MKRTESVVFRQILGFRQNKGVLKWPDLKGVKNLYEEDLNINGN